MAQNNKATSRFIAAALFAIAAIFSFMTPNPLSKVAGVFFSAAAISFIYSGIQHNEK